MTIDIFQWSNMYTLRKSIQWLADEIHVKEECGPYVTKPGERHSGHRLLYNSCWLGHTIPDWPKLLHLYSRLKPGKTIYEWREEYQVEKTGVDVRRFASFGVIKGFLRRVHRWPVYLPSSASPTQKSQTTAALTGTSSSFDMNNPLFRRRGHSINNTTSLRFPFTTAQSGDSAATIQTCRVTRPTAGTSSVTMPSSEHSLHGTASSSDTFNHNHTQLPPASYRTVRVSAAEKVLEQLRNRDKAATQQQQLAAGYTSPRTSWIPFHNRDSHPSSHSIEPSSSTSPYNPLQQQQAGGGYNTSGSVTPTHTVGGLPTPTLTTKSHHNHATTSACVGTGAAVGIGPGAALVSGLQFPPPQGSPSRTASMLGSGGMGNMGTVRHTERRQSFINNVAPPPSPVFPKATLNIPPRPRISRSPSAQQVGQIQGIGVAGPGGGYAHGNSMSQGSTSQLGQGRSTASSGLEYPPELVQLLDGEHHSDELCTRFEVGWPLLERWLELIGGGEVGSEEAKVVVIYR